MQRKAAGDLKKLVTDALVEAGLTYEGAREYWTPRRLTLDIRGLTARSADIREERKGPRTDAPRKGDRGLPARRRPCLDRGGARSRPIRRRASSTSPSSTSPAAPPKRSSPRSMPGIIRNFPWPKSMRWGAASARARARLRWVRPLQSIVCTVRPGDTRKPTVIPFEVDGIVASNVTYGHRFHAPDADHRAPLRRLCRQASKRPRSCSMPSAARRSSSPTPRNLAFATGSNWSRTRPAGRGLRPRRMAACADGRIRGRLPANPRRNHPPDDQDQPEMFRHPQARTASGLSTISSSSPISRPTDGGKEIMHGNGKVVRARLSDALHFWKRDQSDLPDSAS